MNIILLGAPGSGKGTQSEFLCDKKNFIQLSTGDLFRTNILNKTKLGLEAQKYMNQGLLVPDLITNEMVKEYLERKHDNLIFDGYPRTDDQAQQLDKMLLLLNSKIDLVIYIEIDESLLLERLTGRIVCSICKRSYHKVNRKPIRNGFCDFDNGTLITRPDDQEDKIKIRLEAYNTQTAPLIKFYENKLKIINANNLSSEEVYNKILGVLKI
ncbi:adenylate kinase [Spiroplasma taiwanense]|uniref:Adenylate kinase n=1 Tax=Spiroplasma taiwanense CT-1 TaxID=1276220 RepID=S5LUW7_9MOLU|nr:adenylate kinase [Spiroplasma taiwanense]AGR41594.1 adenylate kinase [Spiroplasma taiwanense CT-1]